MKKTLICLAASLSIIAAAPLAAGEDAEVVKEEKIVIALSTDDFTIEETDLGHLAVGDAETIVTDSGKTIDLLRTEDGIEVYVDGELLDMHGAHEEHHAVHKIKVVCDGDEADCDELTWISEHGDFDITKYTDGDHKFIVVHGEGEEWDVESLPEGPHEAHGTVHVIRKHGDGEHVEFHQERDREVIIIRKEAGDEI